MCSKNTSILFSIFIPVLFFSAPVFARAAILSISPSTGTFELGGVFEADVILNTEGDAVNALDVGIRFPPEKLQLVLPTTGKSIISLWITQPSFDNALGSLKLEGVIPGGINVSSGLVTKLRFRVKGTGNAFVKFADSSRTLAHDGKGTDVLHNVVNGIFSLTLPPPLGPIVASETHPDSSRWYNSKTASFRWTPQDEGTSEYSYIFNREAVDIPDDIADGSKTSVAYRDSADGTQYFHIKGLREGLWGGVTHFAVNVDTAPPAEFPIEAYPRVRTMSKTPVIEFATTDRHSGLSHYEAAVIPLSHSAETDTNQPIFVEARSPFILSELQLGNYDVYVRAYDKAGNYREVKKKISVVEPWRLFISMDGFRLNDFLISWFLFFLFVIFSILLLLYLAKRVRDHHHRMKYIHVGSAIPQKLQSQLQELEAYRQKYGKIAAAILLLLAPAFFFSHSSTFGVTEAHAADLTPPIISTLSDNISNEEIMYVGGYVQRESAEVRIYIQNTTTGEIVGRSAASDPEREWFYRHDAFLSPGAYILWVQAREGEELSPPSAEHRVTVRETAYELAGTQISYELLYLVSILILFAILLALLGYIVFHARSAKRRREHWMREVVEAEDAVVSGFTQLRQDIAIELGELKKLAHSRKFSQEEEIREKELMSDLEKIEQMIGKEVLDIERVLR